MSKEQYFCFAVGVGTHNEEGSWLEVFYPTPLHQPSKALVTRLCETFDLNEGNHTLQLNGEQLTRLATASRDSGYADQADLAEKLIDSTQPIAMVLLASDSDPQSVPEAYLKLHLISRRLCKPHGVNLNGIFGLLPNNAWTNQGAIDLRELPEKQLLARCKGETISVFSVDKFPRLTDYVVPEGVRIADTTRVRLGAYLGAGTTIMHEGFVNFNAGTIGPGMIEGRISSGVMVGAGSDLGGGCSTMGTLSGGNTVVISIGEGCLIGANAGVNIALGDRCTIEAGLYLTAGSVVKVLDDEGNSVNKCKARELSGKSDLLFIRNSLSGRVECKTNRSAIELNTELHANN
ncbi:MAG: 2,3,4,5-tetrahydropyridine-2,6-dicarboxylate N-succinyltransferase [Pseudomonadales bacterium]